MDTTYFFLLLNLSSVRILIILLVIKNIHTINDCGSGGSYLTVGVEVVT